tara:strand:- start:15 stop:365 length:351 start_codon:yes stop_codon:yes gene_type:complete
MTISYNKTWEVMNSLEESFNRITTIESMIEDLVEAVDTQDEMAIVNISHALNAYMPVYCAQYQKASQRAWNNTVGEVYKIDNPYRVSEYEAPSEAMLKYDETTTKSLYDGIDLDLS